MSNASQYPQLPRSEPPPTGAHSNHGGTPAAWILLLLAAVGALVIGVGIAMQSNPVIITGVVIVAVGMVVSIAMRAMGKGQPPTVRPVGADDDYGHLRSRAEEPEPTPAVITRGTEPGEESSDK